MLYERFVPRIARAEGEREKESNDLKLGQTEYFRSAGMRHWWCGAEQGISRRSSTFNVFT